MEYQIHDFSGREILYRAQTDYPGLFAAVSDDIEKTSKCLKVMFEMDWDWRSSTLSHPTFRLYKRNLFVELKKSPEPKDTPERLIKKICIDERTRIINSMVAELVSKNPCLPEAAQNAVRQHLVKKAGMCEVIIDDGKITIKLFPRQFANHIRKVRDNLLLSADETKERKELCKEAEYEREQKTARLSQQLAATKPQYAAILKEAIQQLQRSSFPQMVYYEMNAGVQSFTGDLILLFSKCESVGDYIEVVKGNVELLKSAAKYPDRNRPYCTRFLQAYGRFLARIRITYNKLLELTNLLAYSQDRRKMPASFITVSLCNYLLRAGGEEEAKLLDPMLLESF